MHAAHIDVIVAELVLRRIVRHTCHIIGDLRRTLNVLRGRRPVGFAELSLPARQCKGDMPFIPVDDARRIRCGSLIGGKVEVRRIERVLVVAVVDLLRRGFRVVALFIDLESVGLDLARNDRAVEVYVLTRYRRLRAARRRIKEFVVLRIICIDAVRAKSDILILNLMRPLMQLFRSGRIGVLRIGDVF